MAFATPMNYQLPAENVPMAEIVQNINLPYNSSSHQYESFRVNEVGAREYLSRYEWPVGLQDTFVRNLKKIPFRFFICDDSGSVSARLFSYINLQKKK